MSVHVKATLAQRNHVMALIQNLDLLAEVGFGGSSLFDDRSSRAREDLLLERVMLYQAIARLSATDRQLVGLLGFEGLSLEEAGQRLGLRPDVVRTRLYRIAGRIVRGEGKP